MFRKSFPVFVRGFIDDSRCVQSEIETGHLTNAAQKALPVDLLTIVGVSNPRSKPGILRMQLKKLYQMIYWR